MVLPIPAGFRFSGVHCGIKSDPQKPDLVLVTCSPASVAAGVYTENLMYAAPVELDRGRTPSQDVRAVVVNSGNANACTGARGLADAHEMARLTAEAIQADQQQVLVMSTGIIGEYLPMDQIAGGISSAASCLGNGELEWFAAAQGITTTDKGPKTAHREIVLDGQTVRVLGMCKGAGMIGPRMATMLAIIVTDAQLTSETAQATLQTCTDASFNCISVEGHMSTNDTVLLLASGAALDEPLAGSALAAFAEAVKEVCIELARQIADDGEGASHLINIQVSGCATETDARRIAETVAHSNLVKTGIAGADPNWGRIVSAVGYAGVAFDRDRLGLVLNGFCLFQNGAPVEFDAAVVSQSMREQRETMVELTFAEGSASARFWTSDLTVEYVRFNSEYHT
ncbi:MAG: bifunctional ornithine acetyltransferase/N-acetylglutamate synthase [Planctomycetaceae bacterium]|nr:bifunctional ornithine acetyltransferase/N-acetylglutamate synthase [Planctomycetaceae bacterium]